MAATFEVTALWPLLPCLSVVPSMIDVDRVLESEEDVSDLLEESWVLREA